MENFVVSARKYRPATFDTVVGQEHITTTLKNAIQNNHLAQAFLFCGPRGVGKTTCARILAKTINCLSLTSEGEACGECSSCTAFQNNASLNIYELDAASNNSVEDIRSLVEQVRYPPQVGKYKIYIIDEVHMLSNAAFNAFLKTLEEPPSYAIFILATTERYKVIPTIQSRCQIFDFNRIQVNDIAAHLAKIATAENIKAEAEALRLIAQKADGGLRDALSMFDLIVTFSSNNAISYAKTIENLHILDYDYYFKITDALMAEDVAGSYLIFNEILKKGFDGHLFTVGLCEHLRNLLVCKDASTITLLEVSKDVQDRYLQQAKAATMSFLISAMNIVGLCDIQYKASKNQRLHVELSLLKMAHINKAINLARLAQEEITVKKRNAVAAALNGATTAQNTVNGNGNNTSNTAFKPVFKKTIIVPTNSEIVEDIKNPPQQVKEILKEAQKIGTREQNFTSNDIQNALKRLIKERERFSQEQIILNGKTQTRENVLTFFIASNLLINTFNSSRNEWTLFLREVLQNDTILMQAELAEVVEEVKISVTDKVALFTEKYPLLAELRLRLGLELDN